jgi:sulfate adenylyltransferase subunit 1
MELVRVATAGSVDDGKSTLIGRLLLESGAVAEDQIEDAASASAARGLADLDPSLLVDGLRAEREQNITIDVAHRYFTAGQRSFVLADSPGHEQYTRNMVTAVSDAEIGVVLVDVSRESTEQTLRHLAVLALLRVPRVVLCVNKMDLVDFDKTRFLARRNRLVADARRLGLPEPTVIPVSARHGDNLVRPSDRMPWYRGPTLLSHLRTVPIQPAPARGTRLPVQLVLREPRPGGVRRWYAGRIAAGKLRRSDSMVVLPGGRSVTVRALRDADGEVRRAGAGTSVAIRLAEDIDVSQGAMLVGAEDLPARATRLRADLCWLGAQPLRTGGLFLLRHTTRYVRAVVRDIHHHLDLITLTAQKGPYRLCTNAIGAVTIDLAEPIFVDPYSANRITGSFLLIDEVSAATVAAGMIEYAG